jgi:hypothetical protein
MEMPSHSITTSERDGYFPGNNHEETAGLFQRHFKGSITKTPKVLVQKQFISISLWESKEESAHAFKIEDFFR